MAKNFVSNSEDSIKLFKNPLLNALSKVHFTVPIIIFIPVIAFFSYKSFDAGITIGNFALYFAFGIFIWTITEYTLHRFAFHYHPTTKMGKRIIFIFHGVHHDFPRDRLRLVMPPSASIPLATGFYFLFSLFFTPVHLFAFFPGFLLGYLFYDITHYAIHHFNIKGGIFKAIKQHHMLHHYQDAEKGYGVSSPLWDYIFRSTFRRSSKTVNE